MVAALCRAVCFDWAYPLTHNHKDFVSFGEWSPQMHIHMIEGVVVVHIAEIADMCRDFVPQIVAYIVVGQKIGNVGEHRMAFDVVVDCHTP